LVVPFEHLSSRQVLESWLPLLGAQDETELHSLSGLDGIGLVEAAAGIDSLLLLTTGQKQSILRYFLFDFV
jgi:hypothetical protein